MAAIEHRRPLGDPFVPRRPDIDPAQREFLADHQIDIAALKRDLKEVGARRKERFKQRPVEEYFADVLSSAEATGEQPQLYTSAAGTLRRAIEAAGTIVHPWGTEFRFFSGRKDRHQVVGNHDILEGVVRFVTAREKGNGNENKILLIIGKPGSGKSTVADAITAGFEEYTTTTNPAISAIVGCPINEDPANILSLLPQAESHDGAAHTHDLCPDCQEGLRKDLDSDPTDLPQKP